MSGVNTQSPNAYELQNTANVYGDLAYKPVVDGKKIFLKEHSNGVGGGWFVARLGAGVEDGGRVINSIVSAGFRLEREDKTVRASDYGNVLSVALNNCPDGEIYLEKIEYPPEDIVVSRNNLTVWGSGMPREKADQTRLEEGTILRGRLIVSGSGVRLRDMGVDRGSYVTDTYFGGVAADALVVHDEALLLSGVNNGLDNVIGLVPDAVPFHAVLFEKQIGGELGKVYGAGGEWGVVVKAESTKFVLLEAWRNTQGGAVLKSDSYAPCTNVTGEAMISSRGVSGVGCYLYAASEQMQGINIGVMKSEGYEFGTKAVCSDRASDAYKMNDVNIGTITSKNSAVIGVQTFGALRSFNVSTINVSDCASGKSVRIDENCFGFSCSKIVASAKADLVTVPDDHVYLGGRFFVDSVQSFKGYDLQVRCGITLAIEPVRTWAIKEYLGRLLKNKRVSDGYVLPNGWAAAFGSDPSAVYKNGQCVLGGRLMVPGSPWAGKEVCFVVDSQLAPLEEKYFTTTAYDGSFAKFVPVFVTVRVDGAVEVTQLNVSSSFPETITWVGLDGLSWPCVANE